jgi:hypothetical protein
MALTQTFEKSTLVMCFIPSSYMSSLSRELPAPMFRILSSGFTSFAIISFSPW